MKKAWIVGIDEAGRGPLAGPVTLAYVACPTRIFRRNFKGIKDSKKLTLNKKEEWFSHLKNHSQLLFGAASVGPAIIDRRGISRAIKIAIRRCLKKLNYQLYATNYKPQTINYKLLLDGSLYAPPGYPQKTIIRGDEKIPIIAAASIIAKVTRDRKMIRLAKQYPKYAFPIHKGYGTKLHQKLIKKHGLSALHRKSFCTRMV